MQMILVILLEKQLMKNKEPKDSHMSNASNTNITVICSNSGIQNIGHLTNFCTKYCQFLF
jgi:hypothetical protein